MLRRIKGQDTHTHEEMPDTRGNALCSAQLKKKEHLTGFVTNNARLNALIVVQLADVPIPSSF